MVPKKFDKVERRYLALVTSVVFVTAASTPILAQPRNSTTPQSRTENPSPLQDRQLAQALGEQLAVFVGHEGSINSVKFSPDGDLVLTTSDDRTARLWDREGNLLSILQHNDEVTSAEFSPDGSRILTTSGHLGSPYLWDSEGNLLATLQGGRTAQFSPDGNFILTVGHANAIAYLWDRRGNLLTELQHEGDIDAAEFSPDGKRILTASRDETARIWDFEGRLLVSLPHESRLMSAVFSPDGRYILTTAFRSHIAYLWDEEGNLVARIEDYSDGYGYVELDSAKFSPDGHLILTTDSRNHEGIHRLWDREGNYLTALRGHESYVNTTEFSPDSRYILTASDDRTARLWDRQGNAVVVLQHNQPVQSAEFSADGNYLLTISGSSWEDRTTRIWDRQGNLLAAFQREDRVDGVEFRPDGNQILTWGDDTARLWSTSTAIATQPQQTEALQTFEEEVAEQNAQLVLLEHEQAVDSAEFSPDGNYILTRTFNGREPRLWDRRGNLLVTLGGHSQSVDSAEFSPDSHYVLTTSADGTARLWDREGNSFTIYDLHENKPVRAQFSPDGQHILLSGGFTHLRYLLIDRQGNRVAEFRGHSAEFSPDGNFILTAEGKTVYLWNKTGNLITEFPGHEYGAHSPTFSPDGRYILTAGYFEGVRLWDRDAHLLAEFEHEGEVTHVEFSPDDRHLLIFSYHPLDNPGGSLNPTAELWSREDNTSTVIRLGRVTNAQFSPDGRHILTASLDNAARLWDTSGNLLTVFQHQQRVQSANFSPDGSRIVTTSDDKTAHLWDREGNLLAIFRGHETLITSAIFSADGRQIITVSRDNTARVWDISAAISSQAEQIAALRNSQINISGNNNRQAAEIVQQAIQRDQQSTIESRQLALQNLQDALELYRVDRNLTKVAEVLRHIGDLQSRLGEFQNALESYTEALSLSQQAGAIAEEAATLNSLGQLYKSLANLDTALNYHNQALPLLYQLNDRGNAAATLNNIGNLKFAVGNYEDALQSYNQALTLSQSAADKAVEASALMGIGSVYSTSKQWSNALNTFNQALIVARFLNDRVKEAEVLNQLGKIYAALRDNATALEHYNQALLINREVGNRLGEATTLSNMAVFYEDQGNSADAIDYYQQSIAITESIQGDIQLEELKSSFAGERIDAYSRLINLLGAQGDFTAAFNYAERAKARAFLDQIANGRIDFRAGVDAQLLQQEQDLNNQMAVAQSQLIALRSQPQDQQDIETIAETDARLTALKQDYANLLIQIKLQSPATASLVTVDVAPLEEIQSLLEPDTTLVEYFVTGDRTFAFILTRDSFNTVPLGIRREDLVETITLLRDFSDLSDEIPPELQQLHQDLIEPLQPYLNSSRLIIVPHDILHYLPFAALTDGDRYLNDDYVISLLPSANTLQHLPEPHDLAQPTLLALGNPDISEPLSPLQYAEEEVEAIARLFNTQPLIGQAATESAVRSAGGAASILHLAAHGEYDPINSLFSTLHLAADDQHDGRLEVREIYGLDLTQSINLVVLSACQTNIGRQSRGDEIVGLNRAFLYAGTPAVMSSLWNVDDAATKRLMEEFYAHLNGGMSAAEALQKAQQAVRAEYPNPYFWSAFSITGNTRR